MGDLGRYKRFFLEHHISEFKAWYSPHAGFPYQFNTNILHSDIAESKLKTTEEEAIKKGYYRICVGHEINIDSYYTPNDQEFNATKQMIEENSYKKFSATRWKPHDTKGICFFPKLSFLFVNSINDGKKITCAVEGEDKCQ